MEINFKDILRLSQEDSSLHEIIENIKVSHSHIGVKYDFSYCDFTNKSDEKQRNSFSKYRRRLSSLYRFSSYSLSSIKRRGIAINPLDTSDNMQVKFASLIDVNIPWTTVYKVRTLKHTIAERI